MKLIFKIAGILPFSGASLKSVPESIPKAYIRKDREKHWPYPFPEVFMATSFESIPNSALYVLKKLG